MRVHINGEEWYPVPSIFEDEYGKYEMEPELFERYQQAKATFRAVWAEVDAVEMAHIEARIAAEKAGKR